MITFHGNAAVIALLVITIMCTVPFFIAFYFLMEWLTRHVERLSWRLASKGTQWEGTPPPSREEMEEMKRDLERSIHEQ